jgi:hypothetical protein
MKETLDTELAKLSRDVVPPRNLWPAIARGIAQSPRTAPWLAFAAAAAVICFASGLAWVVLRDRPVSISGPPPDYAAVFADPSDPRYVAARDDLEQTFRERLALLDPNTRTQIESNLAMIRQAREDIRKALTAQPQSPVLEQLLESAWHDEFDLYDDVVRTTQPTLARI